MRASTKWTGYDGGSDLSFVINSVRHDIFLSKPGARPMLVLLVLDLRKLVVREILAYIQRVHVQLRCNAEGTILFLDKRDPCICAISD